MNIADMTIRFHGDLKPAQRERLVKEIRVFDGVTLARFSRRIKQGLFVIYDTESINSIKILKRVRQWDKDAVYF